MVNDYEFDGWCNVKIVILDMLSVLYVSIAPCNVIDCVAEDAYLVDRPTVGYRGV
jgi:hypothetical protein